MLEKFKSFGRNPFQAKYLPVLVCFAMAAIFTPITHQVTSVLVPAFLALMQLLAADVPLTKIYFWGYVLSASAFTALAVMTVFVGAFQAAAISAVVAALPLSILFTRKVAEKPDADVQ